MRDVYVFEIVYMGSSTSHETFISDIPDENGDKYWVDFEKQPFSEGAWRRVFRGTMHGLGPKDGHRCVIKVQKNCYAQHLPYNGANKRARRFADKFNSDWLPLLREYNIGDLKIRFELPLISKVDFVAHFNVLWLIPIFHDESYVRRQAHVTIEPFLEGNYEKFNSNGGYENDVRGILLAFSHWTWSISGHKFMICDLQGVATTNGYLLTNPAIHSLNQIYGTTDLGVTGMEMVLANHQCNIYCRALGLDNPMIGKTISVTSYRRSTTYRFELDEEQLTARRGRSAFFSPIPPIYE